ncbi:MAG: rhomboid family intramembrane serine protease [Myxococcales bacterium]|nr:rhomboid family intramembrane serine protease [Myxococcales bacterium]
MIEPDDVKRAKVPAGIDPRAPTAFQRLLYSAVVELSDPTVVEAAYPRVAMVRTPDGKRGVILVEPGGPDDEALAKDLARFLTRWSARSIAFLLVADEETGRAFAEAATPRMRGGLKIAGVDAEGRTWGELPEGVLGERLAGGGPPPDWAAFEGRLRASERDLADRQAFARRLTARRPYVTYTLVAVNVAFFLLQSFLGRSFDPSVPLLVRMGGLSRDLVAEGEVWRLVSYAFLHGGLMHIGFNVLVLVVIGRLIERILGPHRFLILYTACAIAGGLGSMALLGDTVSVGASGALWGILAAEAVLAFGPGFVPAALVPGMRRAAVINLGLNVVNSFRPHVDWAAHFAGGIVGAALLWLVLSRGIPRGEKLATDEPTPLPGMRGIAAACAALLAIGAIAGPLFGDALHYDTAPTFARVEVPALGGSVEVPEDRGAEHLDDVDGHAEMAWGELGRDRAVVSVIRFDTAEEERGREETIASEALGAAVEGLTRDGAISEVRRGGQRVRVGRYSLQNGVRLERAFVATPGVLVRVDVYYMPEDDDWASGLAARVAGSWRATGPAPAPAP